jgi:hypothetical protein
MHRSWHAAEQEFLHSEDGSVPYLTDRSTVFSYLRNQPEEATDTAKAAASLHTEQIKMMYVLHN